MYFEIFERERSVVQSLRGSRLMAGGDWRWRLKGDDDKVVASAEGYPTRSQCEKAGMQLKQEVAAAQVRFL